MLQHIILGQDAHQFTPHKVIFCIFNLIFDIAFRLLFFINPFSNYNKQVSYLSKTVRHRSAWLNILFIYYEGFDVKQYIL